MSKQAETTNRTTAVHQSRPPSDARARMTRHHMIIFALIGLFLLVFFWAALRIGRKRQRRLIQSYDEQLQEYSGRLRRGKN